MTPTLFISLSVCTMEHVAWITYTFLKKGKNSQVNCYPNLSFTLPIHLNTNNIWLPVCPIKYFFWLVACRWILLVVLSYQHWTDCSAGNTSNTPPGPSLDNPQSAWGIAVAIVVSHPQGILLSHLHISRLSLTWQRWQKPGIDFPNFICSWKLTCDLLLIK